MSSESAVGTQDRTAELLGDNAEGCLSCGQATVFRFDKDSGYYKLCLSCGQTEYLNRRFLRFNRQSRQWQ